MKNLLVLMSVVAASSVKSTSLLDHSSEFHWQSFKETYKKRYLPSEEGIRRLIWQDNVAQIIHHNLEYDMGHHSYRKGLNEYADLTHYEFIMTMNGYRRSRQNSTSDPFVLPSNLELPETVDWRKEGLVTPVKNQGHCGSCWAFSTTGSLEGQHKKKTGALVSLSEQNLMDCSVPEGNDGCGGGLMDRGFEYIKKNGGIDTEQSYPYTARDGTCLYKSSISGAICTGYVDIPSGDENALRRAVAMVGPVSVAVDASQLSFHLYSDGIYDESNCSSQQLDHGVLAVGYGTVDGRDYWLVKNSWGPSWGEQGYVRMSRNKKNQCGIATQASYPLV